MIAYGLPETWLLAVAVVLNVGNVVSEAGAPLGALSPDRIRIGARVQAVFADGLPQWVLERP